MSFVGEPFEHDVFVSYAHAERETDAPLICDWSRRLAGKLRSLLSSALNPTVDNGSRFDMFLDNGSLHAGDALTSTLREHAERSAILVVMMSPLYPRKSWCLDELGWFLDQAGRDGRGREHCVPVRIQPLDDAAWPNSLKDERQSAPIYLDLANPKTRLPLLDLDASPASDVVLSAHVQIMGKLESLRKRLQARRAYAMLAQEPPLRPVLYLDAPPESAAEWIAAREELLAKAIVNPVELTHPDLDDPLQQKRRAQRIQEWQDCDALVVLRAGSADITRVVQAAYKDRQRLIQLTKDLNRLPWAIIDRVGGDLPVARTYRVPTIAATAEGWPEHVVNAFSQPPAQT